MPDFTATEAKALRRCLDRYSEWVRGELVAVVREKMRGYEPAELKDLLQELAVAARQLDASGSIHDVHSRLLKRVVLVQRRRLASSIDAPRQMTTHRGAIRYLELEVRALDTLMTAQWFGEVEPARTPRLTDFLSLRFAEQAMADTVARLPREYDEKFQILQAPRLFIPDLAYYRARCALREAPVAVAYLDVDDFKSFNSKYSETRVDRDLLPPLMEALEAHVFAHGYAYRFGGDEYVLLLPNQERERAVEFLRGLQSRLGEVTYAGIQERPTVSIGLCHVGPHAFLTDREVQARANDAKNFAKAQGKDRIATFPDDRYRVADLAVV